MHVGWWRSSPLAEVAGSATHHESIDHMNGVKVEMDHYTKRMRGKPTFNSIAYFPL